MHNSIGGKNIFSGKFGPKVRVYIKGIDFSSHISENNPLVLHYYANKQQTFDAGWDYFTKLSMITCYDLMFYEQSTSFLTSLLWYKYFS